MTTLSVSIVNFIEALAQRNSNILCIELQEKSANLTLFQIELSAHEIEEHLMKMLVQ